MASLSQIPVVPHFAILRTTSVTIPGDERSRTNPGHGYPESAETFITYGRRYRVHRMNCVHIFCGAAHHSQSARCLPVGYSERPTDIAARKPPAGCCAIIATTWSEAAGSSAATPALSRSVADHFNTGE
jgi:hypothetical protein